MSAIPLSDCEIVITRTFDAPPSLVFRTWTEPEHVKRWWLPPGFTSGGCEIDLRVGGMFRMNMLSPDGESYPCEGFYEEISPPERLVYQGMQDNRHACGSGLPPYGRVIVTFVEQGAGTRLTIRAQLQSPEACAEADAAGFGTSWNASLAGLADYIAASLKASG
ncbi:SRPBCC family protein [Viridibacterium curvum]|uniref:SRPBCC family protein n=1 Tax=Viridibacterium curvum TaxID=1101404 RepID=A0ABP9QKI3_9RHOO